MVLDVYWAQGLKCRRSRHRSKATNKQTTLNPKPIVELQVLEARALVRVQVELREAPRSFGGTEDFHLTMLPEARPGLASMQIMMVTISNSNNDTTNNNIHYSSNNYSGSKNNDNNNYPFLQMCSKLHHSARMPSCSTRLAVFISHTFAKPGGWAPLPASWAPHDESSRRLPGQQHIIGSCRTRSEFSQNLVLSLLE